MTKNDDQKRHIEVLKELSTLDPGTHAMSKMSYLVRTSANDIINAGRRLEELGIFAFEKKEDNTITINVVGDAD